MASANHPNEDKPGTLRRAPAPSFAHALCLDQMGSARRWEVSDLYGSIEGESLHTDDQVTDWPIVYTPIPHSEWASPHTPANAALRDALAEAIYAGHNEPQWLATHDGTPNAAAYEYADRVLTVLQRPTDGQHIQYGLAWDCDTNGCDEPHDNPDDIMPRGRTRPHTQRVNGHAVTVIQQTITYSGWEKAAPVSPTPADKTETTP